MRHGRSDPHCVQAQQQEGLPGCRRPGTQTAEMAFAANDKGERLIIYGDFGEAFGLKNIARTFERSGP